MEAMLLQMLPALIGTAGGAMNMINGAPGSKVQSGQNPIQMAGNLFGPAMNMGLGQVGGMPNTYASTLPQFGNVVDQYFTNNPGIGTATGGAQQAATMGAGAANNFMGLGQFLAQMGQNFAPYMGQILNTGFDPQNALRDRTQQQLLESTRAGQAARGLGNSPFGQGLEQKALSDFNIDWQNNLLNRQTTAAQGAGMVGDQVGRDITGGASLMGQAPGMMASSSMLPYQAFNQIGSGMLGALGQYGQQGFMGTAQPQQQLQDFYQLLGLGNQGSGVMNNMFGNQLNQSSQAFNQGQTQGQNFGTSLAMLGKAGGGANPFATNSGASNPTGYTTNPWSSQGQFGGGNVGWG